MKKNLPISSSLEDYLETIAEILEQDEHAHTKDIAVKLGVSMPSVTNALQALAARGLIVYRSHTPVRLTEYGLVKASQIRRRHNILRSFFTDLLKVSQEEADNSACRIEHVVSEPLISRITALTEAICQREDCAGLRAFLSEEMMKISLKEVKVGLIPLDQLEKDRPAELVYISESLRGLKKFADLGIVPGTLLQYEGTSPFGDLIRIKIMDTQLSLRTGDAKFIWVRPLD